MTALEAIDRLIEDVKAGTIYEYGHMFDVCELCGFKRKFGYTWKAAYQGDLNAAKALHEALLDYGWDIETFGLSGEIVLRQRRPVDRHYGFSDGNPARAWLLAILRAHRHQIAAGGE